MFSQIRPTFVFNAYRYVSNYGLLHCAYEEVGVDELVQRAPTDVNTNRGYEGSLPSMVTMQI